MIKTNNLQLLPVKRIHIEAFLSNKSELAKLLQVTVPDSWPHFPQAFSLPSDESRESNPPPTEWNGYFFIHPQKSVLVGNGGFKGKPNESGLVEIGYEIATEYWNRGLATEAVQGLIDYAFGREEVRAVNAHTLGQTNASNRVLQKVGMRFMSEVAHSQLGTIWLWQIDRDASN
ncbi:GNAT family N-acetyltransferase [Microcoleus sp. ARI1-B5]|uniref:GNAT family N-acetyltransferase n=1 Tax=unclassified Microcoleus TaxID=2642155 RepID=UPI002FD46F6F